MSNMALVHLLEYGLTWEKLAKLPKEHVAAFSVICYAASEVNALQRIFLSVNHGPTGMRSIDSAANISKFMILRSWSSKVFEVEKFTQFGGKKPETADSTLLKLSSDAAKDFADLRLAQGYQVARAIRHEASNHYSFSAALKNLSSAPRGMDCDMYLHDMGGNDFFPLGEAVMFHARLSRFWSQISSQEAKQKHFEEWLDWNLAASRWLQRTHANFADRLVFDPLGSNEFSKKSYWVDHDFVGHYSDRMSPVFFRKEN